MASHSTSVNPVSPQQSVVEIPKGAATRKNAVDELPWLPMTLTVEIPVPNFTVGDLVGLKPGSIVKTLFQSTSDVPVRVNGKLIAWAKFEIAGDHLASRITELA
jgi:flagellar motor switch/type III secretory pathway protein FliN